jgi:predicted RNase H-like HicB family nuclease
VADEVNDETTTYLVAVTREDGQWLADVPAVPGTHTWGRTLAGLERSVREAVALALDLPEGAEATLLLAWDINTGDDQVDDAARQVREDRAALAAEDRALQERTREIARQVLAGGLSTRDAARLLGISVQRISQIAPQHRDRVA